MTVTFDLGIFYPLIIIVWHKFVKQFSNVKYLYQYEKIIGSKKRPIYFQYHTPVPKSSRELREINSYGIFVSSDEASTC